MNNTSAKASWDWKVYGTIGDKHDTRTIWRYRDSDKRYVYQMTNGDIPGGNGGYHELESLLKLKGFKLRDVNIVPAQAPHSMEETYESEKVHFFSEEKKLALLNNMSADAMPELVTSLFFRATLETYDNEINENVFLIADVFDEGHADEEAKFREEHIMYFNSAEDVEKLVKALILTLNEEPVSTDVNADVSAYYSSKRREKAPHFTDEAVEAVKANISGKDGTFRLKLTDPGHGHEEVTALEGTMTNFKAVTLLSTVKNLNNFVSEFKQTWAEELGTLKPSF